MPRHTNRGPAPQLYIMRAYHLYEQKSTLTVEDLVNDCDGEAFILFGERDNGKGMVSVAAISHGRPTDLLNPGERLRYTVDTGNGFRCYGFQFICTGILEVNNRVPGAMRGTVPALLSRCNGFVFK